MTKCFVPYKEINFYVPSGHVTYCCKHDFQHAPKIEDYANGKDFLYNDHLHSIKDNLLKGNKIKIVGKVKIREKIVGDKLKELSRKNTII